MSSRSRAILFILLSVLPGGILLADDDAVDIRGLSPWTGREVAELRLEGMPGDIAGQVRKGLALTPRRKLLRMERMRLRASFAEADAQRVRLFLARRGYPQATVTAGGEATDDDRVIVTLRVDPGPLMVYGDLTFDGVPEAVRAQRDSVRILLPRGQRFEDAEVTSAREQLLLGIRRAGHAEPELEVALELTESNAIDLAFVARPGRLFRYEDFTFSGAPDDLVPLVERTVHLEPGTPYSPAVAAGTRRDLRELQLFRQVRLHSEARSDTTLDLLARLQPRNMISLEAGVGSFTDDWLVASASAQHRNLLGGGRGGRVDLTYSTHRREAEGRLWWPNLLARRSRSEVRVTGKIQDEDSYRLDTVEIELSTLFRLGTSSSLRLSTGVSEGTLENRAADPEAFLSDVGLLTVLGARFYRDTSDNPVDPLDGSRLTVQTEVSPPGAWSDTPLASLRVHGSRYLPLGGRRVLALRLDGAYARPLGDALDLRPDRRYFAGGVSTMRGYGRRDLGPVDAEGQPVGGGVRVLAGAEVRLPLRGIMGVAFFVDSGQVWSTRDAVDMEELAAAGGVGVLFRTPVGPLRLDLAYNLTDPLRDQSRLKLSFAIGHPF